MIVFPNIRDAFFVALGFIESMWKLVMWRPDVVFTKGGFVCLPIGLAAHLLKIPLVIHDSDAHPGLTNRVLAKWATVIATGAPLKFYPYPLAKSHYVGVPIGQAFARPFQSSDRERIKQELGFDPRRPLVVVTGGGLGARRLNDAILAILTPLTEKANVILVSGEGQYEALKKRNIGMNPNFRLYAFVSTGMADMLGAADIVVTRAGATTILELASLAKPTILVPNALLTGGHQLKNAAVYAEKGAVSVVDEDTIEKSPDALLDEISNLLADTARRSAMGGAFRQFARPNAAHDMATLVLSVVKRK
jgi:UDP-N-acetylglucosamine--N-acetylmuramyl-(pentapeptide) pyrophosphoryl-undecaprenol N-acetylglucosamine transferase